MTSTCGSVASPRTPASSAACRQVAPDVTADGHGRQTAADTPSADAGTGIADSATGNSPYYTDLPPLKIAHRETPAPAMPLGAKGLGEGNTMSAPVAIANAVADALGIDDVELPLTPPRIWELLQR